jgi:diphosphomevalonate decarboxylase
MSFNDEVFRLSVPSDITNLNGSAAWQSPSNIALVKYWGKKGDQVPANASISFTLKNCYTETAMDYRYQKGQGKSLRFLFEGQENTAFQQKIEKFLDKVTPYFPFLNDTQLIVSSSNSFPHSSGIASSASAMSALALCLCSIEEAIRQGNWNEEEKKQKASFIARIGSGSACRSVYGGLVAWGAHKDISHSSDYYGVELLDVSKNFNNYCDTVLLIDKGQKKVSSTAGHGLMKGHPFAAQRFVQAEENMTHLLGALREGNTDDFRKIVETEALTLHAMMMTGNPYFMLFRPNTIAVIEKIWDFREQTRLDIVFTLDAGANVHILYPQTQKETIMQFIKNELVAYCEKSEYICDETGSGPTKPTTKVC